MSDQPTTPPSRGQGRAALPPPAAEPSAENLSRSQDQERSSNSSLLEAIRLASSVSSAQLTAITMELKGFRKDFSAHVKSLDAMVRYYQRKQARYATIEEEVFRQGVKFLALSHGMLRKIPDSSPLFQPPPKEPMESGGGGGSSSSGGRARNSKGQFVSGGKGNDEDDRTRLQTFLAAWKSLSSAMETRLKTIADYTETPIKLLDLAFTRIVTLPGALAKMGAEKAKQAQNEAQRKKDDAEVKEAKEATKAQEAADRAAEETFQREFQDDFFERLQGAPDRDVSIPDAIAISSLSIGTLSIGSFILGQLPALEGGSRGEAPFADLTGEAYPYAEPMALAPPQGYPLALPPPDILQDVLYEILPDEAAPVQPRPAAGLLYPPGISGPPEAGAAASIFGGPPMLGFSGDDATENLVDSLDDDLFARYFADMSQFFSTPSSSEVGGFLTSLIGGEGAESDNKTDESKKAKFEIPAALMPFLVGIVGALLMIGAGVLLAGVGIGAMGIAIGYLVYRLAPVIVKFLEGVFNAIVDFLNNPGEFFRELITGIGAGLASFIDDVVGTAWGQLKTILNDLPGLIANAVTLVGGALVQLMADAFDKIPILKTVSVTIDKIAGSITSVITGVTNLATTILTSVGKPIEALSGIVTALLAMVGGVVAMGIASIAGGVSALTTFIMQGGITLDKKDRDRAFAEAKVAYANVALTMSDVAMSAAQGLAKEQKGTVEAMAQGVVSNATIIAGDAAMKDAKNRRGWGDGPPPSSQPGSVTNNTTVVNSQSPFTAIPIFGGF